MIPLTNLETQKRKWCYCMPLFVGLVFVAEMAFVGRLDVAKNAALVKSWWSDSFHRLEILHIEEEENGEESCEIWLETQDAIAYSRDFRKDPILVYGDEEDWEACSVGCKFGSSVLHGRPPDAEFGTELDGIPSIHRSMESSEYYPENEIDVARRWVLLLGRVRYHGAPAKKNESALAAAFISNCDASNFRLQALEELGSSGIAIDSYGSCHNNRDGQVDKVEALKHYKFSLAFENSNEEDYVTEKFFQSLVAGTIPVVVGAPNIQEFAPCPGSVLHIKEVEDVTSVAKTMNRLVANPDAYKHSLRWKYEGPSDSFKALVDMAAVHSSCRLYIHLASSIREDEEKNLTSPKRPCKCTRGAQNVYHVYVRERGRFEMVSIFLRLNNLTLGALEKEVVAKFSGMKHVPIWKQERPESIRGGHELKVYRIYPLGLTQRQALYTFRFQGDSDFRSHVQRNPCSKFEVIFV